MADIAAEVPLVVPRRPPKIIASLGVSILITLEKKGVITITAIDLTTTMPIESAMTEESTPRGDPADEGYKAKTGDSE